MRCLVPAAFMAVALIAGCTPSGPPMEVIPTPAGTAAVSTNVTAGTSAPTSPPTAVVPGSSPAATSAPAAVPAAVTATPALTAAPTAPPATATRAAAPVATAAPTPPPATAIATAPAGVASGVRLTIDGKPVPIEGGAKSAVQRSATGASIYTIDAGKNVRNATRSGYAATLELQTGPGAPAEGFAAKDVQVATFTVWKDDSFAYISTGAIPGQPIKDLSLDRTAGTLAGSFETNVSGIAGRFRARIDFNVPFPRAAQSSATTPPQSAATAPSARATPSASSTRQPPVLGKVGQRVEGGGIALTVNSASKTDRLGQFVRAQVGNTLLVVDLTLENISQREAYSNPLYFRVYDADGREYGWAFGGDDKTLPSSSVGRGAKVSGTIAFQVPVAARALVLSYQPLLMVAGDFREIRVQLE